MHPWQKDLLNVAYQYKGKGVIQITGRHAGKSNFSAQALRRLWDDVINRPVESLICDTGRIYGKRYYTVEPVGGNWVEMESWCVEVFGDPAEVWDIKASGEEFMWPENGRWYKNSRRFWFRDEKDRDWFVIRWNA